jgi:hypothetical protein
MFGLEILDVVIGLMFVYLLLSLLATAINEYVSALLNMRGKELARGLGRLLDNLDDKIAEAKAFEGLGPRTAPAASPPTLTERFYSHRLIRPLATRRGWIFRAFSKEPRLPSYIPARTFAMALLDVLGYTDPDAADPVSPPGGAQGTALVAIMKILKRESPLDVSELSGLLSTANLPEPVQVRLLEAFTGSQNRLQHLHDGVEVWFNNAMDRVSGAYKRNVQGWLFLIGLLISASSNADTIDMWRRLSTNDELARAMAARAVNSLPSLEPRVRRAENPPPSASVPATPANPAASGATGTADGVTDSAAVDDTVAGDSLPAPALPAPLTQPTPVAATAATTTPQTPADSAWRDYEIARAELDSMELKLGWTREDALKAGLLTSRLTPDLFPFDRGGFWAKLVGLLLTAMAISLGAPFWFDLLNKVVSIRSAGRSPAERPKSPRGGAKRTAEQAPK